MNRMILSIAIDMLQGLEHGKTTFKQNDRVFRSHFGTSSKLVENCLLLRHIKAKKKHLLWAQLLLFTYLTSPVACTICATTGKTYAKWAWVLIKEVKLVMPKLVSIDSFLLPNLINTHFSVYWFSLKTEKESTSAMIAFLLSTRRIVGSMNRDQLTD